MIAYPTTLPSQEIQDVISTVLNRSFVSNGQRFAKDVWLIAGYALEQTAGEVPTTFGAVQSAAPSQPLSDEEACRVLQSALDAQNQPAGAVQAININWKQVLAWALQILSQLAATA